MGFKKNNFLAKPFLSKKIGITLLADKTDNFPVRQLTFDRVNETETSVSGSQGLTPNLSGRVVTAEIPNRENCNLVKIVAILIFLTGCFGGGIGGYFFYDSSRKLMIVSGDPSAQAELFLGVLLLAFSFLAILRVTVVRELNQNSESNRFESAV